ATTRPPLCERAPGEPRARPRLRRRAPSRIRPLEPRSPRSHRLSGASPRPSRRGYAGATQSPERLTTERLVLEPLRVEHATEMVDLLDDPALHRYVGGRPLEADELRKRYERRRSAAPQTSRSAGSTGSFVSAFRARPPGTCRPPS